jgi:hypothetical protein
MAGIVDDLGAAGRYLDDAHLATRNAVMLLDRISPHLTEDALQAMQILEELVGRVRSAVTTLESAL